MTTGSPKDTGGLPEFVLHSLLLREFANETGVQLNVRTSNAQMSPTFLAQAAGSASIAIGFGRAGTQRLASVKAVAEYFERKFMIEVYSQELAYIDKWEQTSNGFAVHFRQSDAVASAHRTFAHSIAMAENGRYRDSLRP